MIPDRMMNKKKMRDLNFLDNVISEIDSALRTLVPPKNRSSQRPSPALTIRDGELTLAQKKQVAALMRVNHAGEVCAQALYQGQALTAQLSHVKKQMMASANEEIDHLAWCEERLLELGSSTSHLNPLWYMGSLMMGAFAGLIGDGFSLGFVAETEHQVSLHLQKHLNKLPHADEKTKALLEQMHEDESHHAQEAKDAGAIELPDIIKKIMQRASKIMTKTSYYF